MQKDMEKVPIFLETDFLVKFHTPIVLQAVLTLASNFSKTYKGQKKPFQY